MEASFYITHIHIHTHTHIMVVKMFLFLARVVCPKTQNCLTVTIETMHKSLIENVVLMWVCGEIHVLMFVLLWSPFLTVILYTQNSWLEGDLRLWHTFSTFILTVELVSNSCTNVSLDWDDTHFSFEKMLFLACLALTLQQFVLSRSSMFRSLTDFCSFNWKKTE